MRIPACRLEPRYPLFMAALHYRYRFQLVNPPPEIQHVMTPETHRVPY